MKKRIITSTAFAACLALCAAMWPQNDPAVETSVLPTPPAVIAAQPEVSEMLAPGAHSQFGSGKNTQFEPEQRANPFENVFSKTAVFPPPAIAETDL